MDRSVSHMCCGKRFLFFVRLEEEQLEDIVQLREDRTRLREDRTWKRKNITRGREN